MVLVGQVERHRVSQIDVDLISQATLLALLAELPLELARLLGAVERSLVLLLERELRALLDQRVHLLLHRTALVLGAVVRALLQRRRRPAAATGGAAVHRIEAFARARPPVGRIARGAHSRHRPVLVLARPARARHARAST